MKNLIISMLTFVFLFTTAGIGSASDWDKAGKILTVMEGLRFVSGGNIDVIGGLTDAVHGNNGRYHHKARRDRKHRRYVKHRHCSTQKTWIPEYEWKKEWVPAHEQHHAQYGTIHVEGHYFKYQVECGGHWEYEEICH